MSKYMDWQYLVVLDISSIHEYIFGTNKLREIKGASILLDRLNRELTLQEINTGKYGKEDSDWKRITTAGGNVKVLFKDRNKAIDYRKFLTDLFRNNAPGANVAVIVSERNGLDDEKWLKKADKELQRAKALYKYKGQILTSGYFKSCEACGLNPAEEEDSHGEEVRYIWLRKRNIHICPK